MHFKMLDLPAPDGPANAVSAPLCTDRFTSWAEAIDTPRSCSWNRLLSPRTCNTARWLPAMKSGRRSKRSTKVLNPKLTAPMRPATAYMRAAGPRESGPSAPSPQLVRTSSQWFDWQANVQPQDRASRRSLKFDAAAGSPTPDPGFLPVRLGPVRLLPRPGKAEAD